MLENEGLECACFYSKRGATTRMATPCKEEHQQ